ncbi:hypothetical protein ACTG9Q_05005 [Actinokineospora sp. 24-640]
MSRLLDVLPAINRDPRIDLFWVINEGSLYAVGLTWHLERLEVALLGWADAVKQRFDVVIAAHAGRPLRQLNGARFVLQHGVGFNRLLPARTGDTVTPVGISSRELMFDGQVIPDYIGVSDECLLEQLKKSCPQAHPRAVVIGDPTWDRLICNREAWRSRLRSALKVHPAQRIIAVSSTWNDASLWAQQKRVVERLLANLPADEYQVILVLHPNVWAHHSGYKVRCLLADAHEGGLVTMVPYSDWHASVVLGDLNIGDHGSTSVYSAALGAPFYLMGSGVDELAHDSTTYEFVNAANRLAVHGDIRLQVERALAEGADADVVAIAGRPLFRHQGESLRLLNEKLYEIMRLPQPECAPKPAPYRPEIIEAPTCRAFHVFVDLCQRQGEITLERFPAALSTYRWPRGGGEYLLVVEDIEADSDLLNSAEIVVSTFATSTAWARERVGRIMDSMLYCSLAGAAVDDGCVLRWRKGLTWHVRATSLGGDGFRCHLSLVAAAVHQRLASGEPSAEKFTLFVNVGRARMEIAASPI